MEQEGLIFFCIEVIFTLELLKSSILSPLWTDLQKKSGENWLNWHKKSIFHTLIFFSQIETKVILIVFLTFVHMNQSDFEHTE